MGFENILGKVKNAGNQDFLHYPEYFPTLSKTEIFVLARCDLSSSMDLNLVQSQKKKMSLGKL